MSADPAHRLGNHMSAARCGLSNNVALAAWLLSLSAPPEIVILAQAPTRERAIEIETFLTIDLSDSLPLLNENAGNTKSEGAKRKQAETSRVTRAKLSAEHVGEILALRHKLPMTSIARRFGISPTLVRMIHLGKRKEGNE